MSGDERDPYLDMTQALMIAYVSHNQVSPDAVSGLMRDIYETLKTLGQSDDDALREFESRVPAIAVEQSVTDDFIYSLEDGMPYKSLKRHLKAKYNLSPEAYRERWGLSRDYPMVAPNYAKERSRLAKKSGLGKGN